MDVEKIVRDYLQTAKTRMMQLATSSNNQPWVCTLYYALDEDLSFIWLSLPERRHSQEIVKNPNVAGAIAHDQQPPVDFVRGLQFEGKAKLLEDKEEEKAAKLYIQQLGREKTLLQDIRSSKNPHKVYKVKVQKFVLVDSQNFPKDSRQEWIPNI